MDDKLKPCPFCGGVAQRVDIPSDEHDPNAGGSYIACQFCLASSSIAFGDKSSLVDNWNNRKHDARIRAEARAEAAERAINLIRLIREADEWCDLTDDRLYAAILADEPKEEREAEVGWVSVSDRLPSKDGQYLVDGPHDVELACWNGYHNCWDHADGDDYWKDPVGWFTHWMEIPPRAEVEADISRSGI